MSTYKLFSITAVFFFTAITFAQHAAADDIQVYESLTDITIGRVFLSPEQRRRLDELRGKSSNVAGSRSADRGTPRTSSANAAGYIVGHSGKLKVWSNGDFVASDERGQMRFPGDVKVTRKGVKEVDADSPGPTEAGLQDSGAVDDEE